MQVGISVNLIFLVVGLVVSSAVPPLAFLLTWRKVPSGAAITAALAGQACGIIAWLVHTQVVYGAITQDTSQVRPSDIQSYIQGLRNLLWLLQLSACQNCADGHFMRRLLCRPDHHYNSRLPRDL